MQWELTVRSTADARYDGSIDSAVKDALGDAAGTVPSVALTYDEGGVMFGGSDPSVAAENHFGIEVPDEMSARLVALLVANRLDRPVAVYRFGDDVDPMTTPRYTIEPGDLPTALRIRHET
jgi:hypothetical protein